MGPTEIRGLGVQGGRRDLSVSDIPQWEELSQGTRAGSG